MIFLLIKNRGCEADSETHQQEFPWDDEGDYTQQFKHGGQRPDVTRVGQELLEKNELVVQIQESG
jgi:hypothetical protein